VLRAKQPSAYSWLDCVNSTPMRAKRRSGVGQVLVGWGGSWFFACTEAKLRLGWIDLADPVEIAVEVARIFDALGIRYVLGGSLASTTFGEPRTTLDVDLAADIGLEQADALVEQLSIDFIVDPEWSRDEIGRRGSFQAVHRASMIRIDVFVPEWTGFDLWKWEQRRSIVVDPATSASIHVTSPEGIVLQKLLWYRKSGESSERQWRDVVGVLKAQHKTLDVAALTDWGQRLGLEDLLRRAVEESH